MNNYMKTFISKYITLALLPLAVVGCTEWDDHYDNSSVEGSDVTIWEQIKSRSELSDFAQVLENTMVFRQHKKTTVSYADILNGGRSLTVFAPVNGTFNKDSLLQLVQTAGGDSAVERCFIKNHMTQKLISTNGTVTNLRLLNDKHVTFNDNSVGNILLKDKNIHSKNGIMHVMESKMPYQYTIYEALTNLPQYKSNGEFIASYNEDYFNENASVSSGIVDGKKVYVDSVIYERNRIMEQIGLLNDEDSTYYVVLPTEAGWQKAWEQATSCFAYPKSMGEHKADSLQKYWAYRALMDDAIFSKSQQNSIQDSVVSRFYNRSTPEYHVFYKPFDTTNGIFGKAQDSIKYSNGIIYSSDEWAFKPWETYQKEIEVEAEYESLIAAKSGINTITPITGLIADSISKGGYMSIKGSGTTQWSLTYRLSNVLSGKYDVKVVVLPKSVENPDKFSKLPCKFSAIINYIDEEGNAATTTCVAENPVEAKKPQNFVTNGLKVDTITVARGFKFPACNYDQNNDKVSLTIKCTVTATEGMKYNRAMFLDAIFLEPSKE